LFFNSPFAKRTWLLTNQKPIIYRHNHLNPHSSAQVVCEFYSPWSNHNLTLCIHLFTCSIHEYCVSQIEQSIWTSADIVEHSLRVNMCLKTNYYKIWFQLILNNIIICNIFLCEILQLQCFIFLPNFICR